MSEILQKSSICSKISEHLKQKIKYFHIFDEINVLFVTNDDKVIGLGLNSEGCCGFGHNNIVDEPLIISELCNKGINQFFIGKDFIVAINHDHLVYGWGQSNKGQLGFVSENQFLKPMVIFDFKNVELDQIGCGSAHCLALTTDGKVYGWGSNKQGQLGFGRDYPDVFETIHLDSLSNFVIKSIHCLSDRSYALTIDGIVYSWGSNTGYVLGHELANNECVFEPRPIIITNIESICLSKGNTYFLDKSGIIYFCGKCDKFQKMPKLLITETKYTSLHTIPYNHKRGAIAVAVNEQGVYLFHYNTIEDKNYKTLQEFISEKYKVTHKTIKFDDLEKYELVLPQRKGRPTTIQSRYSKKFNEISEIGSGGFGHVFKVINKTNREEYAIKKISYSEDDDKERLMREVKALMKSQSDYVVKYIDWWDQEENSYLFIQMELCSDNLKNIIKQKSQCFKRTQFEAMNAIEYYISCKLFKELLECVQYLHGLEPPIIHRDLKPENILIGKSPVNGKFLKLCDFGLAKFIDSNNTITHTRSQGTVEYMAPEVMEPNDSSTRYNIKADIYSLGKIAEQLFDIKTNLSNRSVKSITDDKDIRYKGEQLENMVIKMLDSDYHKRPTCAELLSKTKDWTLDMTELNNTSNYKKNVKIMNEYKNQFFSNYFSIET